MNCMSEKKQRGCCNLLWTMVRLPHQCHVLKPKVFCSALGLTVCINTMTTSYLRSSGEVVTECLLGCTILESSRMFTLEAV